jgi:cyclic pyranopterin monophosphate synthase
MNKLTHIDEKGKAIMVDIGQKAVQQRNAKAEGHIRLAPETLRLIEDNQLKKGDVLTVAQIAGINAAKHTSDLIPLCHNIALDSISVVVFPDESGIIAESEIKCTGRTGAEMEALAAVSVALLTVYDMCKAVDKFMVIDRTVLLEKSKK